MPDIIITLPRSIPWGIIQKEFKAVENGLPDVINFKVPSFPDIKPGERCFVLYDGFVRGYHLVHRLWEGQFQCDITGLPYKGKFIQRTGRFHRIDPIPMRGFQGFRYSEIEVK